MKKLKLQGTKILKMFHILFAFSWAIGALVLCILVFIIVPESGDELYMRSRILQIIDDYFIIAGAIGCFFTGLLYSILTNWGFFKHKWITLKWIIIILQTLVGTFILGPCVDGNVEIAYQLRDTAFTDVTFISNFKTTQIVGSIQTLFILAIVVISVQKP
jgi:hypothetical protein